MEWKSTLWCLSGGKRSTPAAVQERGRNRELTNVCKDKEASAGLGEGSKAKLQRKERRDFKRDVRDSGKADNLNSGSECSAAVRNQKVHPFSALA